MANQPAEDSARIELTLPKSLKAAAKARAERNGESLSAAVRRFLEEYVR